MWLPKEIRQAAKRYGGDDLQKIEHFIEGAKYVYINYGVESWNGTFVREEIPCVHGGTIELSEATVFDEPKIPTFEDFYDAYQYKKARPQAERMWNKLSNRQKIEIMESLPAYLASTPDKQFRMHPATYINPNNERWKDEITVRNNNGTKQSTNNVTEQDFFASEAQRLTASLASQRAKANS